MLIYVSSIARFYLATTMTLVFMCRNKSYSRDTVDSLLGEVKFDLAAIDAVPQSGKFPLINPVIVCGSSCVLVPAVIGIFHCWCLTMLVLTFFFDCNRRGEETLDFCNSTCCGTAIRPKLTAATTSFQSQCPRPRKL